MASNYLILKKYKRTDMAFDELLADHFIKSKAKELKIDNNL
jgi:hypothetical protein